MHAWESIQKTVDYIENNIGEEIHLEKLAEVANLSYFYFHRLFAQLVKRPVQEYIKLRRLARAVESVKDKNKKILDIAVAFGFNSHETFTRAFKDAYGFTPTEYRDNPVGLNSFNKPDLLLGYVMVDEGVPLVSDGMVLEMNRRTLDEPIHFVGVRDFVRLDWYRPNGKVTGVDDPGATWARFHEIKHNIEGVPSGRELGVSYGGAPEGHFSYFAGKEASPESAHGDFIPWTLHSAKYVVCGFEADSFEDLVTNAIYKANTFIRVWMTKHNIAYYNSMSELYFPNKTDVNYMEIWYPINEESQEEK
ncbi:MAG: AraC family transcriptional regulator [Defluviitaleaceae bacterium]|nr:AraC family transcriptional regulator [Defluviitaleaceae bacterium]MCL2238444.1 AraC family transcriptional regulator [Defluviitaleaceae bacterium]